MPKIAKITGGAGTQKTSHLIRQIERDLQNYFPKDIGAVSLTKAAVKTIKDRMNRLGVSEMTGCGTIHSLAYSVCLDFNLIDPEDTPKHIKEFLTKYPKYTAELGKCGRGESSEGYFNIMQKQRNLLMPRKDWKLNGVFDRGFSEFCSAWFDFNAENGLTDYTGMLEMALKSENMPTFKVLYVDEAQDQTPLATALIMKWAAQCEKVAFYGDDDQSLYRFSGASPESFIELPADFESNRPQSFRCPPKILDYAMRIIKKCHKRIPKEYAPLTPDILEKQNEWRESQGMETFQYTAGNVYLSERDCPDLSFPGRHMILTRANYQLNRWRRYCIDNLIPFCNPYRIEDKNLNPCETKIWRGLSTYQKIKKGDIVSGADAKELLNQCKAAEVFTNRGTKNNIEKLIPDTGKVDQFFLLSVNVNEKFIFDDNIKIEDFIKIEGDSGTMARDLLYKNPAALMQAPKVILGTVHSVKGGEAENVWFDVGVTPSIKKATFADRTAYSDECRVAYVAITRARRNFGLLNNKNRNEVL